MSPHEVSCKTNMPALNHKIDFALIFTARNANPNGDPLDGNRPRTTYDGIGEVSDVCLKRKIRNRLMDAGYAVFVQSDDRRIDGYRSLKERAEASPELKACMDAINNKKKAKDSPAPTRDDYAAIACKTWIDVRAFGQVFSFKKGSKKSSKKSNESNVAEVNTHADTGDKKSDDSEGVSIGVRGPVTIQPAFSIAPVNIVSSQITKSVNLETGDDPDKKAADTMGMKHRVEFGVYKTFGSINVQTAQKTGFTEEDAEAIKEALRTLFRNDATSARPDGSMEVVQLVWWTHNCANGQYPSAKVHRSVHVTVGEDGVPSVTIDESAIEGLAYEQIDGE